VAKILFPKNQLAKFHTVHQNSRG